MESAIDGKALKSQTTVLGYRLGLFDPDPERREVTLLGPVFLPSERSIIRRAIRIYNKAFELRGDGRRCLGEFPVEG